MDRAIKVSSAICDQPVILYKIAVKHDLLPVTPLSSAFDRSGLKALGEDQVATDLSDLEATSEGV